MADIAPYWIYEVNVEFDPEIREAFTQEVKHHVEVITSMPGFKGARWFDVDGAPEGKISWCIQYHAVDKQSIEHYFNTKASELRAGTARFGEKVKAHRRILRPSAHRVPPKEIEFYWG